MKINCFEVECVQIHEVRKKLEKILRGVQSPMDRDFLFKRVYNTIGDEVLMQEDIAFDVIFVKMFDFAKKKRRPILADISRRLHLLTTDAKPDPPRDGTEGYTNNLSSTASDSGVKSNPTTPDVSQTSSSRKSPLDRRRSDSDLNGDESENSGLGNEESPDGDKKDFRESKNPRFRTKIPYKAAQTANIVNYNIINSNGIKIGATKTYVCNVNQCTKNSREPCDKSFSGRGKTRIMPKTIEDLSTCEREITIDDIFVIKTHIGHGWRDVVRRLGYSEGQLDQFQENHKGKGIDEVIYQAFLDWKQANTKNAQIGILASILWACKEYDCAERLAAAQETPA